jgi:hypothetical protein
MVTRTLIIVTFICTLQVLFIPIIFRSFLKILSVQFHSFSQVETSFLHSTLQSVQPFCIPYIPARVVILSTRTVVNSTVLLFDIFTGFGCEPNPQLPQAGKQRCLSFSRNSLLTCLVRTLQPANSWHHCVTHSHQTLDIIASHTASKLFTSLRHIQPPNSWHHCVTYSHQTLDINASHTASKLLTSVRHIQPANSWHHCVTYSQQTLDISASHTATKLFTSLRHTRPDKAETLSRAHNTVTRNF